MIKMYKLKRRIWEKVVCPRCALFLLLYERPCTLLWYYELTELKLWMPANVCVLFVLALYDIAYSDSKGRIRERNLRCWTVQPGTNKVDGKGDSESVSLASLKDGTHREHAKWECATFTTSSHEFLNSLLLCLSVLSLEETASVAPTALYSTSQMLSLAFYS